ncbi:hypothetical protein GCM10023321_37650 [Pseudonocardia eucalypti]|uniref:SWIM-type domain-containing protein n=1 Tax=Pseudonocardia eucalypti TaxID=648755 RepID=A0ABP9QC30_9PSEU|nr:hypothetical protein [Pseudonocardia eucalypti]
MSSEALSVFTLSGSGVLIHYLDGVGLSGLLARLPTELVTVEREHRDDGGVCSRCPDGREWPCVHVQAAWDARVVLGWPLPGEARDWAG